jgi:hypothetical protein
VRAFVRASVAYVTRIDYVMPIGGGGRAGEEDEEEEEEVAYVMRMLVCSWQ